MSLVPLPVGISDAATVRGQDRAATDVAYIQGRVMSRLTRAFVLDAAGRAGLRGEAYQPGGFADAESAASILDDALADGSNAALSQASSDINYVLSQAASLAQGGEALESKTLLQSFAGTDAAATVIRGGAIAAGVQEELGDPLGTAAAIKKEIANGNDPDGNASKGLQQGRDLATIGLGVGVVVAVAVGVFAVWYFTKG